MERGEATMPSIELEEDMVKRARQRLREFAAGAGLPAAACRVAAQERADLIVLGSRERHGLANLVDFTEDGVLHAAPCDVLAVRLR